MRNSILNDMNYNFEPLELFVPNPSYKIDEKELKKSIEKNKELITRIKKKRQTINDEIKV